MKKFFVRIRKAFFYPYIRETENAAGKMPRECGEIAQERRVGEMVKKTAAKRESAHRKLQRNKDRGRRDWSKRRSRKADSQPEQIEEGSHSRIGSGKQTQREGETARAHSRRAGEDAEQLTSRHRSERRAGAIQSRRCGRDPGQIFGRSSNHARPITSKNQSEAGEAKEKRRAHAMPGTKKATTIKGKIYLEK